MGAYRWCIVANAVACVGSDLIIALWHPEPQLPQKLVLVGGLLKHVPLPDWMVYALINATTLFFAGVLASILVMFAYRYNQTTDGRLMRLIVSNKLMTALVTVMLLAAPLAVFVKANIILVPTSQLKARVQFSQPEICELLQGRNAIYLQDFDSNWMALAVSQTFVLAAACVGFVAYCIYGCYAVFRDDCTALSTRTRLLYRVLVRALLIDIAAFALVGVTPALILTVSLSGFWQNSADIATICLSTMTLYPLATHFVWLCYITPYRRAVLRMVGKGPTRVRATVTPTSTTK